MLQTRSDLNKARVDHAAWSPSGTGTGSKTLLLTRTSTTIRIWEIFELKSVRFLVFVSIPPADADKI